MSSLQAILNYNLPCTDVKPPPARVGPPPMSASPRGSPAASATPPTGSAGAAPHDVDYYAPSATAVRPHAPHPDCPDTLACLPDADERPQHTLPVILRCAILGSPRKRLTIREIYSAMEAKYPWYRTAGPTWKQSVRHHLSLNRLFEKVPRPATDPGFGSYWTCNLAAPTGTKRPRKRGRNNTRSADEDGEEAFTPAPKPRGRTKRSASTAAPDYIPPPSAHHPFPADIHIVYPPPHTATSHLPPVPPPNEVHRDPAAPHGDPFGPVAGTSTLPPSDSPPTVVMNDTIGPHSPSLPVHVVYPAPPDGPAPTPDIPAGAPGHEPSQLEILQALVGRLNAELATTRWQADTLSHQVARLTEDLTTARDAALAAEAVVAEETRRRTSAEEEMEEMRRALREEKEARTREVQKPEVAGDGQGEVR